MDNKDLETRIGGIILNEGIVSLYEKSDPIFHYTSPEGVLGILKAGKPILWFSQYDSLNDTTEGTHVVEVYQSVCDELFGDRRISLPFYQAIHEIKPMEKEAFIYSEVKNTLGQEDDCDWCKFERPKRYICCFSKNFDSLPMWNYYTKGNKYEGYNIGFNFYKTAHTDVQDCYGKGYHLQFFTVIYDDKEKKSIIRSRIKKLYSLYQLDQQETVPPIICNVLSSYLKELSLIFKKSCFCHEQEVRAILTVGESCTQFEVKYRSNAGYIIPYIEVPFPKDTVSGITIGPLLNDKTAVENIKQFAKDRGYHLLDNDIRSSKIPIRY